MSNILDSNRLNAEPDEEPPSTGAISGDRSADSLEIEIHVEVAAAFELDESSLVRAARRAAVHRGYSVGEIGIQVTDDASIRQINARHLGHDYPTDVISFGYAADRPMIQGEMVVSACTAAARAAELGWPPGHELMLYVVHGTLHITGMDDHDEPDRAAMRRAEHAVMTSLGIVQIQRFGVDQVDADQVEAPHPDAIPAEPQS